VIDALLLDEELTELAAEIASGGGSALVLRRFLQLAGRMADWCDLTTVQVVRAYL
jgi:hypothetical protein